MSRISSSDVVSGVSFVLAAVLLGTIVRSAIEFDGSNTQEKEIPQWSAVELLRNQHRGELSDWQKLQLAIAFTESRFKADAVGSHGDSGVLQLLPIYVAEVNRLYGTDYQPEDAFDVDKSLDMFELMQQHYNPEKDIDEAIRRHNKSPYYRSAVLDNLAMIERYEELRKRLMQR